MEEVEHLCQRVVIMDHGKIIAQDTLDGLRRRAGNSNCLKVELAGGHGAEWLPALRQLAGVRSAEWEGAQLSVLLDDLAGRNSRGSFFFATTRPAHPSPLLQPAESGIHLPLPHWPSTSRRMTTRPFFAIVRKDLQLHVGNRRALILTLAIPIVHRLVHWLLSVAARAGRPRAGSVSLQVVDLDQSTLSAEIITNLSRDDIPESFPRFRERGPFRHPRGEGRRGGDIPQEFRCRCRAGDSSGSARSRS